MDKGTEKEEIRLRSLYMPAEMAAWGDDSEKENNQMKWLKGRVNLPISSIKFNDDILAWAAIVWGIISVVKKQG